MKYILCFSVVSLLVHDSAIVVYVISLEVEEIWDPLGKVYKSRQKEPRRQSILQFVSSGEPRRAHLENRCLREYPNENSNTSQQRLDLLLESRNMASSDKTQTEVNASTSAIPSTLLKVEYDYEYDYKTRKVSVKQGEILGLLQKTNEHWWKVVRPGINKAFFVPAQYVTPHHNGNDSSDSLGESQVEPEASSGDEEMRLKKRKEQYFASKTTTTSTTSSSSSGNNSLGSCTTSGNNNNHNNNSQSMGSDNKSKGKGENSKAKGAATSIVDRRLTNDKPSGFLSKAIKIGRNEGSRASHRDKAHSRLLTSSSTTKISSSSPATLKNWSASLEELSKQIVFPGLSSESVADLTSAQKYSRESNTDLDLSPVKSVDELEAASSSNENGSGNRAEDINKCLSFRNPSYNNSQTTGSRKQLYEEQDFSSITSLRAENSFHVPRVKIMENTKPKYESGSLSNRLPDIPSPSNSPVRVLTDNWAEYYSSKCSRYFYYNDQTKVTSWKPPRNSPVKKPEDNLGSSLSDASAHASSFEKSLENIPDLVENNTSSSKKRECQTEDSACGESSQSGVFLKSNAGSNNNLSEEPVSSIKLQSEDEEGSNADSFLSSTSISIPIPDGWDTQWDESTQQICYVNKVSGARWFSSTDAQERIYFYKENSNNSSWFLPPPENSITQSQSSTSKSLETDSLEECDTIQQVCPDNVSLKYGSGSVMKRHSAGEVTDRGQRTKSLILQTEHRKYLSDKDKLRSLPRTISIWTHADGKPEVLREGTLARTKITENGKKLRKSWGPVYAVLTESHLSLFKDQKSYDSSNPKTEVEIDLMGASVEWTDKSRRKNVFQLDTLLGLQMLFQVDDHELAEDWYQDVKSITDKGKMLAEDKPMRLLSTESPEHFLDASVVGERRISSRINRKQSTKFRITSSSDEPKQTSKIKAHLNKFFNRRPPRESLVKKGIYKDESVFGCSLTKLCELEKRDVPRFVEECIIAIEAKDENLKTDGIYRASGNLSQVQKIRLQVDQNNLACLYQEEDVHVLAGCLKLFFRELKEPLIPYDLYEKALEARNSHYKKEKDRLNKFREIVSSLAKPNKCTLQHLLKHLLRVADLSDFNRMQIPNLAIVFGPTLMWPAVESQNMALDLMQQNLVIEKLLIEYDAIFQ